ncbi:beta-galactosidase [Paucibacter sp. PLA-PC-4]|uniref:beta-galactosidase n=1 Tax=Paucibacter sp. PLA-PC-4 TaxID=2993655 RepID=UPI00224A959C|nr:beta-galactosidase [Paucibacter sp. PLA-PC-4]MCX2865080.1 beta-galactosidase [Paucibacter sp. PLA-PC-4]
MLSLLQTATLAQDLPGQTVNPEAVSRPIVKSVPKGERTFLMSAFTATSQNTLSLFSSTDGISFTSLGSEVYTPPKGLLRDPSIMRAADGFYYIVYTTGWSGTSFGVSRSADLRRWQHVADIGLALPGLSNVWAPEWFRDKDGSLKVVLSLSKGGAAGPFAAYYLEPLSADFSKFSAPQLMRGLENNTIDTFVVLHQGQYTAFTKNESSKLIELATAPALSGPWTLRKTGDWAGWGGPSEGQSLVPITSADGRSGWRIYFDDYTAKRYWYSDSFDGFESWTPKQELGGVSGAVRHFTVIAEETAALERAAAPKGKPKTIAWDRYSLIIDGRREMIFGGEFHPFRLPSPSLWRDVLQKIKASGLNTVALYFAWGYHSAKPGHYDFSTVRNIERALQMAAEEGLYVIVRPGPYVNAELSAGGFPGWLLRQRVEARTDAPAYQEAADEWLSQINAIVARHQITNGGGTVIAYQLENELFSVQPKNIRHMQHLADKARADGITVPLFHNAASRLPDWTPKNSSAPFANPGPTDIYAFDGYPGGVCGVDGRPGPPSVAPDWGIYGTTAPRIGSLASPNTPGFVAEIGGGWFDYWGSNGTYECTAQRQGPGYQRVFYGTSLINSLTIHSIYMAFGGTSWGWLGGPVVYTSYDYGAAITEARSLRDKAKVLKQMGSFVQAATPVLAQMDKAEPITPSNPGIKLYHNINKPMGTHVLFAVQNPSSKTGTEDFSFRLQTKDGSYQVPQAGRLQLSGQDAKMWLASYAMERQHLVYTTSEIQTHLQQGPRDLVLLYGRAGEDGETVLRFARKPKVELVAGHVDVVFDGKDLRLNYQHRGLIELRISEGDRAPLTLLIADEQTGWQFWRDGQVLVQGTSMIRSARLKGQETGQDLALIGDTMSASPLRIWAPGTVKTLSFNGAALTFTGQADSLRSRQPLPGPSAVQLPDLMHQTWTRRYDSLEADPSFDDSAWRHADAPVSAAHVYSGADKGQPVLAMSDYGFHRGDVWYRGRFKITERGPQQLELFYGAGGAGLIQVWLDGKYLGQQELDTGRPFPETTDSFKLRLDTLVPGEHQISVLVRNNSHNWDLFADDEHKEARGLIAASLAPRGGQRFATPISWKIQGNKGGEDIADLVRGPMNNGGLYGERMGWHLPPAPDRDFKTGWDRSSPTAAPPAAGSYWLRTHFTLDLPRGHDVQLGLAFGDTTKPRSAPQNRALIFVNGWHMGQFISHIGPQRVFVIPPGILNPNGENTLALVVTTDGQPENALEPIKLVPMHIARGGVTLEPVPQSPYLQR